MLSQWDSSEPVLYSDSQIMGTDSWTGDMDVWHSAMFVKGL